MAATKLFLGVAGTLDPTYQIADVAGDIADVWRSPELLRNKEFARNSQLKMFSLAATGGIAAAMAERAALAGEEAGISTTAAAPGNGGIRLKSGPDLSGGGRYRNPQAWIDRVVETDPALSNVELSYPPRYSGRLKAYGQATLEEPGVPGYTSIGRPSLVSRRELLDTIIHEETHHRLWQRAQGGSVRAWNKIADIDVEEAYVEEVASRFLRLQDYLKATGRK